MRAIRLPRLCAALCLTALLLTPAPPAAADALTGPTVAAPMPRGEFRLDPGFDPDRPRAEAVIGKPNFVKVESLSPGSTEFALSRMVGQLWFQNERGKSPWCTGFLVGPDLFLTNYHCLADMETLKLADLASLTVAMEHLRQDDTGPAESQSAVLGVLKMDHQLDYGLLRLSQPLGKRYGWLPLEQDRAAIGAVEAVKIIQHPAGRSKEIVLEDTGMVRQDDFFLHYRADTEGGSSGSPVFALDGQSVIALHHVGSSRYNEGVSMAAIAVELAAYLPQGQQGRAQDPAPQPPARSPIAAAPVTQPVQDATGGGAEGTAQASILDLLLAPPPPIAAGEPPITLGLPAETVRASTGQQQTQPAGSLSLESGVTAGQGSGGGLMKLNFD